MDGSAGVNTGGVVVQKFGGTSVATPERIIATAERVAGRASERDSLIVVMSAMGKTTDELVALAHEVSTRPVGREMDLLLSTGEQVAVSLLGLALQDRGIPATPTCSTRSNRTASRCMPRPPTARPV